MRNIFFDYKNALEKFDKLFSQSFCFEIGLKHSIEGANNVKGTRKFCLGSKSLLTEFSIIHALDIFIGHETMKIEEKIFHLTHVNICLLLIIHLAATSLVSKY